MHAGECTGCGRPSRRGALCPECKPAAAHFAHTCPHCGWYMSREPHPSYKLYCPKCDVQCIVCEEWGPAEELARNNDEPMHDECKGVLIGRLVD